MFGQLSRNSVRLNHTFAADGSGAGAKPRSFCLPTHNHRQKYKSSQWCACNAKPLFLIFLKYFGANRKTQQQQSLILIGSRLLTPIRCTRVVCIPSFSLFSSITHTNQRMYAHTGVSEMAARATISTQTAHDRHNIRVFVSTVYTYMYRTLMETVSK